jgi:hypothetical protein
MAVVQNRIIEQGFLGAHSFGISGLKSRSLDANVSCLGGLGG